MRDDVKGCGKRLRLGSTRAGERDADDQTKARDGSELARSSQWRLYGSSREGRSCARKIAARAPKRAWALEPWRPESADELTRYALYRAGC